MSDQNFLKEIRRKEFNIKIENQRHDAASNATSNPFSKGSTKGQMYLRGGDVDLLFVGFIGKILKGGVE